MEKETVAAAYAVYARRAPSRVPALFHELSSDEQDAWTEALEEVVEPLEDHIAELDLYCASLTEGTTP